MKNEKENILIQSNVDTIIVNVTKQNRGMQLNDIKKIIKDKIRRRINSKKASEIDIDYIIDVITKNRDIIFGKNEEENKNQNGRKIENYKDREGER